MSPRTPLSETEQLRLALARAYRDLGQVLEKPRFTWNYGITDAKDRLCRVMIKFRIPRDLGKERR